MKTFTKPLIVALFALAMAATGCGDDDGGGSGSGGVGGSGGGAGGGGGDASLLVENLTGEDIIFIFVSPCTDATWGSDQLGEDVLADNSSFRLTGIDPGCYDLRADTLTEFVTDFNVDFGPGEEIVWTLQRGVAELAGDIEALDLDAGFDFADIERAR